MAQETLARIRDRRSWNPYGMQTFEMGLRQLVHEDRISVEVARQAMD